jgi:hypothetical protein
MRPTHSLSVVFISVSLLLTGLSSRMPVAAQQPAGLLASWGDLETWSRYDERRNESEVGLGLQPTGKMGPMLLSFSAKFPGKVGIKPPDGIVAQVGVTPSINPNVLRTPTLVFLLDAKTPRASTLDVSQRMSVDAPGPGAVVTNGRATLSPEEFLKLIGATTLHAEILGLQVEIRRDQLRAMRDFAERLHIGAKSPFTNPLIR